MRVPFLRNFAIRDWSYLGRPKIKRRKKDGMPRGNKLLRAIWRKANK